MRLENHHVSVQGHVVEVTIVEGRPDGCAAVKLDAEHWLDVATGEIREYERKSGKRVENVQELYRSFRAIRALVNTNCTDPKKIRWITLTYAENMRDAKRLYEDFRRFWAKFVYRWGKCEYIAVAEPQARGAWHMHVIAIWDDVAPFVPNAELAKCWGHGFVKVNAVREDVDNLGAYLSAYLADVQVDAGGTVKDVGGASKRFLKGGRLGYYPSHMNIYRTSRGIRKPDVFWADTREGEDRYLSLTEGHVPVWEREVTFKDDEGRTHKVVKQQYNLLRG